MTAYTERGRPVVVLARHRLPSKANPPASCPPWLRWTVPPRGAPRNCLVRRESGERLGALETIGELLARMAVTP